METTENNLERNELLLDVTLLEASSGTLANGTNMMTSNHSTGISFENSVGQQQTHFELGLAELAKSNADLLNKRIRLKGNKLALKNNVASSLLRFNQNLNF